jgi:hypothetical protein
MAETIEALESSDCSMKSGKSEVKGKFERDIDPLAGETEADTAESAGNEAEVDA